MTVKEREMLQMCGAGCSAVSWQTKDGCVLWGRNMDFNRMAQGSAPTFFPRGQVYCTCGSKCFCLRVELTVCETANIV